MTIAVLLRSGMTLKCHVPFWRAVEEVTPLLTLIFIWRVEGTILGQFRLIWAIRIFSILFVIQSYLQIGFRSFGSINYDINNCLKIQKLLSPPLFFALVMAQDYVDLFSQGHFSRLHFSITFPTQRITTEMEWERLYR